MEQITGLNTRYVERKKAEDVFGRHLKAINAIQNNLSLTVQERIAASEKSLKEVSSETDCKEYSLISNTISLGDKYLICLSNIYRYRSIVISADSMESSLVQDAIKKVADSEMDYTEEKEAFCKKNNLSIDSADALGKVMMQSLENAILTEKQEIEELKNKVRGILKQEPSIELKVTDALLSPAVLPERIVIGRQDSPTALEILKDIGVNYAHRYIRTELRKQGNILVKTDFEHKEDEEIDAFVIAYILRFIESFPIGAVQIHIFKQTKTTLYDDLMKPFISPERGEAVHKIIKFHSDYYELSKFKDVTCEEISKKLDYTKPDLYSIYENGDKSDAFHLIILRDGLTAGGRASQFETLGTIRFLSDIQGKGHNCGLRFLIVDTNSSSHSHSDKDNEIITSQIREHCELKLNYSANGKFEEESGNKTVETKVLCFKENPRKYITERAKKIADKIGAREKGIVSFNDVFAVKTEKNLDNILYIPIGLSGSKVVEIPFSCANTAGTAAGQCIGYMVLGMTGFGKGSLFNSIVLNGCMKYSPQDLQFWLLDFKFGTETAKYRDAGLPHIKVISERNQKEDASYLFHMIREEMERRSNAFAPKHAANIAEYNRIVKAEGLEGFPRILIIIDEVQEIFLDSDGTNGSSTTVKNLIASITARMRNVGLHFVMISQNLSVGNAYMLKEAFLQQVTGRICFRLYPDSLRDSGFGEEYTDKRRTEIKTLNNGEAYVSYGADTIRKVKMAYAKSPEMVEYFQLIRERYPEDSYAGPLVIGASSRLSVTDNRQGLNEAFSEYMKTLSPSKGICQAVIGESVYGMCPVLLNFSQLENSSVLFLGGDKNISSSLCASTAASLLLQGISVHLVNGDMQNEPDGISHPFKFLCEKIDSSIESVNVHIQNQFSDFLQELYREYLERKSDARKSQNETPVFLPVISIINDLMEINSFLDNEFIEVKQNTEDTKIEKKPADTGHFNFVIPEFFESSSAPASRGSYGEVQRKNTQDIIRDLFENGYRYNMHFVIALKKYPDAWRSFYSFLESKKSAIFFNSDSFTGKITSAGELKEKLKSIKNQDGEETVALWLENGNIDKIRPILYRMSDNGEKIALASLINVGKSESGI